MNIVAALALAYLGAAAALLFAVHRGARPPLWLYRALDPGAAVLALPIALWCARSGSYPWWLVTPDDPVSPFGCGTTPGASVEPTMQRIYRRWGRYVGDVVWLAWRNKMFGLSYFYTPQWLKDPGLRYMDLQVWRVDGQPFTAQADRRPGIVGTVYLAQPDGTMLTETTCRFGPLYVIHGHRLSPILDGALEDRDRVARGEPPVPRPTHHPNMAGRPILTVRTRRTL